MIWILLIIDLVHNVQSSLPSMTDLLSRTRWCMGEGAHCPVNLPFDFPSCCKPFICTEVAKTRKPTIFLKFVNYTDHRCLLPASDSVSVTDFLTHPSNTEGTVKPSKMYENGVSTTLMSDVMKYSTLKNNVISVQNISCESLMNSSFEEGSKERTVNTNSEYEYSEDYVNGTQLDKYINTTSIENRHVDNSKIQVTHIVKRSTSNYTREYSEGNSSETPSTSLESNQISEMVNQFSNVSSVPDDMNYHDLSGIAKSNETKVVDTDYYNSSIEYYDDYYVKNQTFNQRPLISGNNSTNEQSKVEPFNIDSFNSKVKSNNMYTLEKNISLYADNLSLFTTTELKNTKSEEDSEEDWHSSQMQYDTRPVLHKVVTIRPINLFDSVQVIRLNESIETSAD